MPPELYFAYGSNLSSARLLRRVPSARVRAPGRLRGFALSLDKRGSDGSGKANLCRDPDASVWGVVWTLDAAHWDALDVCEGGYERVAVRVETDQGPLAAQTYQSNLLTGKPVAFAWYKRFIVEGAREHGLPPEWIAQLEALPEREGGIPAP